MRRQHTTTDEQECKRNAARACSAASAYGDTVASFWLPGSSDSAPAAPATLACSFFSSAVRLVCLAAEALAAATAEFNLAPSASISDCSAGTGSRRSGC
eukprot:SAG11_NODE_4059_length_2084_cov_1.146599_2_plen_99_part_00